MINFKVNGKEYSYENSISLRKLVENLNIGLGSAAVEHNLRFVKRDEWGDTMIADGDKIELIKPFSGG